MFKKIAVFLLCFTLVGPLAIHAADDLYLGGDSIGIEIDYDGVMISGTYSFTINDVTYDPGDKLKPKDIIQEVDGTRIHSIDELYKQLGSYKEAVNNIPVVILRDQQTMDAMLTTVYDEQQKSYKSGLYVKDKIVGVGTMTYYDPQSQTYGALGHEIYDVDIKQIAQIHLGSIYPADVQSIQKAQSNIPGEKHAQIDYNDALGDVVSNTEIGVYGHYDQLPENVQALPWAHQDEITTGKATIYTVLNHEKVEAFEIDITKLNHQDTSAVKGIEFRVSDERLRTLTNGIIQGMSGSPIVQNGKIIGAVTHVVTSNPMNGYGVYIEWMLDSSRNLPKKG